MNLSFQNGLCLERRKDLDGALQAYVKARMLFDEYDELMSMVHMYCMSRVPVGDEMTYRNAHLLYLQIATHFANVLDDKGMEEEAFEVSKTSSCSFLFLGDNCWCLSS